MVALLIGSRALACAGCFSGQGGSNWAYNLVTAVMLLGVLGSLGAIVYKVIRLGEAATRPIPDDSERAPP